MVVKDVALELVRRVGDVLRDVDEDEVGKLVRKVLSSRRIYVFGAGRSGLVAKAFAMRLMHLGFDVHVVGETITPAMDRADLLVAISGSGKTSSVLTIARTVKEKVGAQVAVITSYPDSPLGEIADVIVKIPGRVETKSGAREYLADQIMGRHVVPVAPLGTLFEISTMVFLDAVVVELMRLLGKGEDELRKRHANLE